MRGIYQIRNTVNGALYVGSAVSIPARFRGHRCMLKKGEHHSVALQRAWAKYGEASFVLEVIETVTDKACLVAREQHYIDLLKPRYNTRPMASSNLGHKLTPEQRRAISNRQRGKKRGPYPPERVAEMSRRMMGHPVSQETREKLRQANLGKSRGPTPEETRRKLSESQKGKPRPYARGPRTPEQLAAVRAAAQDRKFTPEQRQAISEKLRGHQVSEESREKIREKLKGRPVWWQLQGYASLQAARAARVS